MQDTSTLKCPLIDGMWSVPEFEYLADSKWEFTEKIDGTNIRVIYDKDNKNPLTYRGKTDDAMIPLVLLDYLHAKFDPQLPTFETFYPNGVTLYGKGYDQSLLRHVGLYSKDPNFVMFDVKIQSWWLSRANINIIEKRHSVVTTPVIGYGTLYDGIELAKKGIKSFLGDFNADGIVAKPMVELYDKKGNRIITKLRTIDLNNAVSIDLNSGV